MARLHEQLETDLDRSAAFAFVADFANASRWDPGVAWSERADGGDELAVGARYRLGVRVAGRIAPMEYRVVELVPDRRVVLEGEGSGVSAVDEISFQSTERGTLVDYRADIRLRGWLRVVEPFAGAAFAKIARDARSGMQQALDKLASQGSTRSGEAAAA
jgi:carbon monoxide dehydrogenase subunit G